MALLLLPQGGRGVSVQQSTALGSPGELPVRLVTANICLLRVLVFCVTVGLLAGTELDLANTPARHQGSQMDQCDPEQSRDRVPV